MVRPVQVAFWSYRYFCSKKVCKMHKNFIIFFEILGPDNSVYIGRSRMLTLCVMHYGRRDLGVVPK